MNWLRLYFEVRHDPKVQGLPAPLFRHWINLLTLAGSLEGVLPEDQETIAFELHVRPDRAREIIDKLVLRGLLTLRQDGRIEPHNWRLRQYKSDDSYARVKRFRSVSRNGNVTPPEYRVQITDIDHLDRSKGGESERGDVNSSAPPPTTPARATPSTKPAVTKHAPKPVVTELTPGQRERLRQDFATLGEGFDDYLGEALSYYQPLVSQGKHSNLYACVRKSLRTALERRPSHGQHQNNPARKPAADTGVAGWLRFRPQGETPH